MSDITELKDKVAKFLRDGQERFSALEEKGIKTDEGLEAIRVKFTEVSEELQKAADKIAAEEAERKALEAMVARIPETEKGNGEVHTDPEYAKAFRSYLRSKGSVSEEANTKNLHQLFEYHGVKADDGDIDQLIMKTGLVGSNPDGGFLAPIDPVRFISQRIFESSPIRMLANVISTAREAVSIVIDDGQAGYGWVGEVDTRSETTTPQVAELEIPTHEMYAEPKLSQKAIDDVSINLESWLQMKIATRFARAEASAFVNGDGQKKPKGILDYGSWTTQGVYERFKYEHRDTATVGTIAGDDFIDVQSDLLEEYQANATWLMHRKVWAEVMQLKDSDNQYLLNPMLLFSGVQMQLLGRPVRFAGDMDSTVDEGNSIAIYGDFREGYTVVDRIGIRVIRDAVTTKGFVKFYTTRRVGGAGSNFQALKVLDVQAS